MTSGLKQIVRELETERDHLQKFLTELDTEIRAGQTTPEMAQEILHREFGDVDARALLTQTNERLEHARSLLVQERPPVVHALGLFIGVALLGLFIVNFGAITGLFVATGETFYAVPLDLTVTQDQRFALAIDDSLSSLRLDGKVEGKGTASVFLEHNGRSYLIAAADLRGAQNALTGFVVEDAAPDAETLPPQREETTEKLPLEEVPEEDAGESDEEQPAQIPEEILDATPQEDEPVVNAPQQTRSQTLEGACQETCLLPDLAGEFSLRVETRGDVTLNIERITYGTYPGGRTKQTNQPSEELPTPEEPNVSEPTTPAQEAPPLETPTEETPVDSIPIEEVPVQEPEEVVPEENPSRPNLGLPCTTNEQCGEGYCAQNTFQGTQQQRICVWDALTCTASGATYGVGTIVEDSVCVSTQNGAQWIVRQGRGRFAIENADGALVATLDKFGTLALKGTAAFNAAPGVEGWLVRDSANTVRLSIDNNGNLASGGTLTQLTKPQRTNAGDFVITTATGTDAAIITQQGNVALSGILLEGVELQ